MRTLLSGALRATLLAATAAVALGAAAAPAAAQDARQYLKFEQGNVWTLEDQATGQTREIRCDYNYRDFRYVTGLLGGDYWFGYSSAFRPAAWVWNEDEGAWSMVARWDTTSTRTRWSLNPTGSDCDNFRAGWASISSTIRTPAGTFTGCRQLTLQLTPPPNVRCMAPPEASIWIKYGVGIVKITTPVGEEYLLKSAIVGNAVYPQPGTPTGGDVVATLTADQATYTNKPNTIRCITTPCPSNEVTAVARFSLVLTNNSTQAKSFNFTSGCQVGIEVLDQNGRPVAAMSDRQFCTMALTAFTLQPGQSKTLQASMELKDRNDLQLNGTYTARGYLLGYQAPEARIPISVAVRP